MKKEPGITLIALVITIIVLLILAGITLTSVTGNKGVIKEAKTAKELSEKVELEELIEVSIIKAEQKHKNPNLNNVIEELKNSKIISKESQVDKETGAIVTDAGYEITGKLDDYIGKVIEGDEPELSLIQTEETKPYLPDDKSIVLSNDIKKGIVVKDRNQNEWVWIEVPKSIYPSSTTKTSYSAIESAMQTYASAYRENGYVDAFDSTAQDGFTNTTEYNNWKNNMLSSVFENGGFYIGRYEVGTDTVRTSSGDALKTPFIQRDKYPYNYITCSQAQTLAKQLSTGEKQGSLMFGIQWDLVMKFIETKKAKTQEELKNDSINWGNYYNIDFTIERGSYSTDYGKTYAEVGESYPKPSSTAVLLTTGATDRNSVLGLYDIAGNAWEWTLEKTTSDYRKKLSMCQ